MKKFRLHAWAFSCTYKREKVYEDDMMTQEDWDDMSESEQKDYLEELAIEFLWEDMDCEASLIEE